MPIVELAESREALFSLTFTPVVVRKTGLRSLALRAGVAGTVLIATRKAEVKRLGSTVVADLLEGWYVSRYG